jgi:parallel beta-helix repeat protein
VASNHVHHTGGPQGDGIELKQGSAGCRIEENTVHDTNYPGILAYGSDGGPRNVIEGNVVWAAATNPFQVQGEALVRNNLVFGGATPAFVSFDHQGSVRDLTVVHNTFVTTSAEAARLGNWSNRPGMVLANNALYSESGLALSFLNGASGVTIEGNVVHGGAYNDGGAHHQAGLGVTDFVALRFDGTLRDAHPSVTSRLVGAASTAQIAPSDASGAERSGERSAGAYERGTYGRYVGASVAGSNGAPLLRSPGLPSPAGPPVTFTLIHAAPHAFAMHGVVWIPTGAPYSVERSVSVVNAAGEATFLVDPPTLPGAARARVVVRDATAPGGVAATQWIEW